MLAVAHPAGGSLGVPTLLSDLADAGDVVRRLLVTLAADDLVLYWSPEQEAAWPASWHKGLIDRDLQVFRTTGSEVAGKDLLAAYRSRMVAEWTPQRTRTAVGAD